MKYTQQTFILLLTTLTLLTFSSCSSSSTSDDTPQKQVSPTILMPLYKTSTGTELYKVNKDNQELVKDINRAASSSHADNFCSDTGLMYFTTIDDPNGYSLWKSTGSNVDTTQVSSQFFKSMSNLTCISDIVYFNANDKSESGLWRSDGTEEGTYRVTSNTAEITYAYDLTKVGNTLYFYATYQNDRVLWRTDGTPEGSTIVKHNNQPIVEPDALIAVGNDLFYFLSNSQLWKTNGTDAGTQLIKDNFTSYYDWNMKSLNGYLLFYAADSSTSNNTVLWRSNGTTAGTITLKDSNGNYISNARLHATSSTLYVIFDDKLYKSDTNSDTLTLLASAPNNSSFYTMEHIGETLYFILQSSTNTEIWSSNGTSATTSSLLSINNIIQQTYSRSVEQLINVNGTLFFTANDSTYGYELWKSDLTQNGTAVIKNIHKGAFSAYPLNLMSFRNELYFTAYSPQYNREIWKSDGTNEGTILLKNINDHAYESSLDSDTLLFEHNDRTYFVADDGIHGEEIWVSDGSTEGTYILKDIAVGATDNDIRNFTSFKNLLYFTAEDTEHGRELWKTDGTTAGTLLVKDIYPGPNNSYAHDFVLLNDSLYFYANTPNGTKLFISDGTDAGTYPLDQSNGDTLKNIRYLNLVNDKLYFQASGSDGDVEPYVSDGTTAGTHLVKNINLTSGSYPEVFVGTEDMTFFTAHPIMFQAFIYTTDGSTQSTTQLKDSDNNDLVNVRNLVSIKRDVYFQAYNGTHTALWKSDGTSTELLKDQNSNILMTPKALFVHDNLIYFSAAPETEMQLFYSDGTSENTKPILDNVTGEPFKVIDPHFQYSANTLFFVEDTNVPYALDLQNNSTHKIQLDIDDCRFPELRLTSKSYETSDNSTYLRYTCMGKSMHIVYSNGAVKVIGDVKYDWY